MQHRSGRSQRAETRGSGRVLPVATWAGAPRPVPAGRAAHVPAARVVGLCVFALAWLAAAAFGQPDPPCFQGLGDLPGSEPWSRAYGLSADGSTVIGASRSAASGPNGEAFRWRADTGMIGLGDLSGGVFRSWANAASADGAIVVGLGASGADDTSGLQQAFRWSVADGMVSLGDLPGGWNLSQANGVSYDGAMVGGATFTDRFRASIWTADGGWQQVDSAHDQSNFDHLARSGLWACGIKQSGDAIRWSAATGLQRLGDLPGGEFSARAKAISDDGRIVVGWGTSTFGPEAFRWTAVTGMVGLGDFAAGEFASAAWGLSADGTVIVGHGTTTAGLEAALRDSDLSLARVADVLAAHGVAVPAGWTLESARDVVVQGDVVSLCGSGTNPAGHTEAWLARYRRPLPTGACCLRNGGCVEQAQGECAALAGATWRGPLTDCADADDNGRADVCACALGDVECDRDLDLVDFARLAVCYGAAPPAPDCPTFDSNFDAAVDSADLADWMARMTGPQDR